MIRCEKLKDTEWGGMLSDKKKRSCGQKHIDLCGMLSGKKQKKLAPKTIKRPSQIL